MSAAAAIMIRRKRLIRRFREAGAVSPENAVVPESVHARQSWVFRQMADAGVFLATTDGRYFLDEQAAAEFMHQKRMRGLVFAAVVLSFLLVLWAFGMIGR